MQIPTVTRLSLLILSLISCRPAGHEIDHIGFLIILN